MIVSSWLADFVAGLLLCNCICHLVSGLQGETFPTPFAKPHGVGRSSAIINFLWGSLNLLIGGGLLARFPVVPGFNLAFLFFALGFLILGVYLSCHFAAVRRRRPDELANLSAPTSTSNPTLTK